MKEGQSENDRKEAEEPKAELSKASKYSKRGGTISRRKLITSLGVTGAAALSGGMLYALSNGKSANDSVYAKKKPITDAEQIRYYYAEGQVDRTIADKLREMISVKDWGALGDGITDDTQGINAAIDYVSNLGGGTIYIPRGIYMIDAVKANNTAAGGVILKSNIRLVFDQGAIFKAIPNDSAYYSIISAVDCDRIHISGANLVGDRDEHTGSGGEWGHGILLFNADQVTIDNASITNCWGDGIYIRSSNDVMATNCILDNNRRQGMSIISGTRLYFHHCQFKNTNGTAPQAGVDIEPNQGSEVARNITFTDCKFLDNRGRGLVIDIRRGATCENIKLINSELTGNVSMSVRIATRDESLVKDIYISNVIAKDLDMGILNEANIVNVQIDQTLSEQMVFRNMEGLSITRSMLTSKSPSGVKALALGNVTNAIIRDVAIVNSSERGIGLVSGYNEHITLDNVQVISPAGHGIQATNSSARFVTITNCLIKGAILTGIEGVGQDWIVANNQIHENGKYGLRLVSTAERSIVIGNNVSGNAEGHIVNDAYAENMIANNIQS